MHADGVLRSSCFIRRSPRTDIHRQTGYPAMIFRLMPGSSLMTPRFLTLADVAETLNISAAQTYALVRSAELKAIKVGGRGQWRVEASELESYIAAAYQQTAEFVAAHPFGREDSDQNPL